MIKKAIAWLKSLGKRGEPKVPTKPITNTVEVPKPEEIQVKDFDSYLPVGVVIKYSMMAQLQDVVKHGVGNKQKYLDVQNKTGVPWRLIVGLHYRESSLSFKGVLHNGEYILGTGKKTKLVPAGRGPFTTWEEAAIDALMMKKSIFPKEWTPEACHEFCERFNGLGYRNRGMVSPYVWGGTTKYKSGLFVKDGVLDRNKIDQRLGTASIMESLKNY